MHIILGYSADPLCEAVLSGLTKRGHKARILETIFSPPHVLDFRIGIDGTLTQPLRSLRLSRYPKGDVESVLVRSTGYVDPTGWRSADHAYVQSENQAALLAWLTALDCPVVNRVGAELWYRPRNPLAYWLPRLARVGLSVPSIRISTNPEASRAFRRELEATAVAGAVCGSLTQPDSRLVGPADWRGIEKLQALTPVYLIEPHRMPCSVCIVGKKAIWNKSPGKTLAAMTEQLVRFADIAGLDLVELVVGRVNRGWAVVDVDPVPQLFHFGSHAQTRIVSALVDLLQGAPTDRSPELEAMP